MTYSGRHPWDANDPYPDDDYPECDHVDYESDILTGIAACACGHRWMQTDHEIAREREAQIAYDNMCEQWQRDEQSLTNRLRKLVNRMRARWRRPIEPADEIPF